MRRWKDLRDFSKASPPSKSLLHSDSPCLPVSPSPLPLVPVSPSLRLSSMMFPENTYRESFENSRRVAPSHVRLLDKDPGRDQTRYRERRNSRLNARLRTANFSRRSNRAHG